MQNKKILFALVIFVAVAIIGLIFCFLNYSSFFNSSYLNNANGIPSEKIIIGTETWPGYIGLYIAEAKGYYQEEGINVEVKRYLKLSKLSDDYVAGKLQGRANLTLDAVNETLHGLDHRIVLAIDYSKGADAIVAKPGIKSINDLAGKRVVFEKDTFEEYFLLWALEQKNMKLDQLISMQGDPETAMKLLMTDKTDVAVTHEPFLSELLKNKNFSVIFSSADAPGLITDVLTFHADFIHKNPESIRAILRAYFKALDFVKTNPKEAYEILAKEFEIDANNLKQQFAGIEILDKRDNQTSFSYGSGLLSLYGNLKKTNSFIMTKNNDAKKLDTNKLIEPKFIREIVD